MAKRKKNYLNNKDMLREIHLSKISYCSFRDKLLDSQQDFIVEDLSEITPEVIEEAKEAKASRLTKEGTPTKPADIATTDLVFRVMTEEHIPLVPKKKSKAAQTKAEKKAKSEAVFDDLLEDEDIDELVDANDPDIELVPKRTNFPPFFHYRLDENNVPFVVGKSHWRGDLETGEFCQKHGKTTDNLAMMYMKLCERYGTRSNWRGYTYNDEMQGQALVQLTHIGLRFNELKSQNPFAYYTAVVTNSFTRVLNIEKRMQEIRDDILEANGMTPSWTRQLENESTYSSNELEPKEK